MACPQEYTSAGFELQLGTNHFGHFAMVQQLIDKLQAQVRPLPSHKAASVLQAFQERTMPCKCHSTRAVRMATTYACLHITFCFVQQIMLKANSKHLPHSTAFPASSTRRTDLSAVSGLKMHDGPVAVAADFPKQDRGSRVSGLHLWSHRH